MSDEGVKAVRRRDARRRRSTARSGDARDPAGGRRGAPSGRRLLWIGLASFAAVLGSYLAYLATRSAGPGLSLVDLRVYRAGGFIARHVAPPYDPGAAAPLYTWHYRAGLPLKFTYPPFAAVVFALASLLPWRLLAGLSVLVDAVALLAALWFALGGLGWRRGAARAGAALLAAAAVWWTEPVVRTVVLGQINLVLMALVLWDLSSPADGPRRWWRGAGIGVAAGIKLVPLIFIPYLVLTRRFRQAAVACGAFAATVAVGAAALPADSARWWVGGLFLQGGRTGFVGWEGNQSLLAFTTRLAGSPLAARSAWLTAAALTLIDGLAAAALLHRAGHALAGALTCALTGLLVSPVSWDHHWVWVAPAAAMAGHYAARAWRGRPLTGSGITAPGPARLGRGRLWPAGGFAAIAAALCALYGAWPGSLWWAPHTRGGFSFGVIWAPPETSPADYYRFGDQPWFAEYHWHGWQLLTGNAYLLGGLALLALAAGLAARSAAAARAGAAAGLPGRPPTTAAPAPGVSSSAARDSASRR